MIPILGALLGTLAENGLGLLSSAIQAKGKEVVENTLGVKIPDSPTPADVEKLRQLQYDHEERLIELGIEKAKMELEEFKVIVDLQKNEADNVTKRWESDNGSDSWLNKNIRPATLVYILSAFLFFALLSAFGLNANESYVTLLGNWGQIVMLAYFGGKTVENVMSIRSKGENK